MPLTTEATTNPPITRRPDIEALTEAVRWPGAEPRTAVILAVPSA